MTKEQLAEILAVCAKATEGPWRAVSKQVAGLDRIKRYSYATIVDANGKELIYECWGDGERLYFEYITKEDAQFIALARTALPELAEDYRKLAEYALQVEKALDLLLDNLFEMDDETCPADVDGKEFCCDVNICGVERPYKKCWLKFYLDKAKAGEAAGYGGEE